MFKSIRSRKLLKFTYIFIIFELSLLAQPQKHLQMSVIPKLNQNAILSNNFGRYQLFQGKYNIMANGSIIENDAIFRIDTMTGEVWIYWEGSNASKAWSEWRKIDEVHN